MPVKSHGFNKQERLCSLKLIEGLFVDGNILFHHPFRIIWRAVDGNSKWPVRVAIAVPKRNFKKAVHRNLLKRRIREAYRKQKEILYKPLEDNGISIILMLQYTGRELSTYGPLEMSLAGAMKKIAATVCSGS
jgi:ribonuclease P protein component